MPAEVPADGGWVSLLLNAVIWLTELCVPLFFVISGFLFFLNDPADPPTSWFGTKLGRRIHSLLIPYLIANCVALACYAAVSYWFPSLLSGFLGDRWKDPLFAFWTGPVNLSLWFIRELMRVSVLAPVLYLLVRYTRWWGVIALGVLGFTSLAPLPWFYFSLGAMIALDRRTCELVCSAKVSLSPLWRGWCYFIYLYHYIPLLAVKKMAYAAAGALWMQPLCAAGSALAVLLVLSAAYLILQRYTPKVLGLIIGGK